MEVGLCLPQFGGWGDPAHAARFAVGVEELGYDSLWVGDRLLTPTRPRDLYPGEPKPYPPEFTSAADPLVLWSAAAAVTTTIRLGSSTLNAPWYNPVLLARSLTTIDVLSEGRLDVGFGLSWMRDEYDVTGTPWRSRGARLDETLDLLEAWWTQNPVEHHGTSLDLPETVVDLRPRQPGGPPVYLGGASPAALARVGRRADGWLALSSVPRERQELLWRTALRAAESAGRDPGTLRRVVRVNTYQSATDKLRSQLQVCKELGYDGAFLDLTYCASDVDHALEIAARLMA